MIWEETETGRGCNFFELRVDTYFMILPMASVSLNHSTVFICHDYSQYSSVLPVALWLY